MRIARRILSQWKVLVAAFAICAAAPSARADLTLNVAAVGGNGPHTALLTGIGQADGSKSGTFNLGAGYFLDYTISQTYDPSSPASQEIAYTAVLRPATSATSPVPLFVNYTLTSSGFTQPAPLGPATLTTYVEADLTSSSASATGSISAVSQLNAPVGPVTTLAYATADPAGMSGPNYHFFGSDSTDTGVTLTPGYTLSSISGTMQSSGSTGTFRVVSTVALPEPSGVVAAFAGLPCMGALLGFARRYRRRSTNESAAA